MTPKPGETRFVRDIRQTDEGFVCQFIGHRYRAGLGHLHQEANKRGQLLVISRLEGKILMPWSVCSAGYIYCCDHAEIRDTMASAIDRMASIEVYLMAWPRQSQSHPANATTKATTGLVPLLLPPKEL